MRSEIDAAALTTFEVALNGSSVRLNVLDQAGEPASLILPAACVNGFKASFGASEEMMMRLGQALVHDVAGNPLVPSPSVLRS
jgi:hypothetical protein